ncbi:ATP-binding cassette domain-containing protein [Nakamurella sp. YIM 132087]|uniref:ATP-binding cassette domain-containing protein n=1 Tax=Nakamurella alba TaxID=2665158 RepID=A0A7K1FSW6_9ACTN|nr:ABC transporter ATP-binding protein [Nakamurella alba]MTD17170.1 ATP-binding cassette domain-containing protein [Nakamurella alba]
MSAATSELVSPVSAGGTPLLDVRSLTVGFRRAGEELTAVRGIDFTIGDGERVALVGESGSGKSVTARSIMRLSPGAITTGEIRLAGEDILAMKQKRLRQIRGGTVAMVMQDPLSSLNPVRRIGDQVAEALRLHGRDPKKIGAEAIELLDRVGIPDPANRSRSYPHELSGGQRQRVVIAIALAGRPKLLIADEPTTALDVRLSAQILDLLRQISTDLGTAVLMITHDLGVVADFCERTLVMYAGRIVENAPTAALFNTPLHPYASGLLSSVPRVDEPRHRRFASMAGEPVRAGQVPAGCAFAPRCPHAQDDCRAVLPALAARPGRDAGHLVACHHPLAAGEQLWERAR